jgi:hypothetical protein
MKLSDLVAVTIGLEEAYEVVGEIKIVLHAHVPQ